MRDTEDSARAWVKGDATRAYKLPISEIAFIFRTKLG